jgi:hypothetical protein
MGPLTSPACALLTTLQTSSPNPFPETTSNVYGTTSGSDPHLSGMPVSCEEEPSSPTTFTTHVIPFCTISHGIQLPLLISTHTYPLHTLSRTHLPMYCTSLTPREEECWNVISRSRHSGQQARDCLGSCVRVRTLTPLSLSVTTALRGKSHIVHLTHLISNDT